MSAHTRYSVNGYDGCVQLHRSRKTGHLVGVYNNEQAGMDDNDGLEPWSTVCEEHNTICSHRTLALARDHAGDPMGWCEECAEAMPEERT